MLGDALSGLKQFDRAIAEFETALELKPKDVDAQIGLAEAYRSTDQKEKARELIEAVLKLDPNNERAQKLRAE